MLLVSSPATATTVTADLPQFSGPLDTIPVPPLQTVGTFAYTLPTGETIVSAIFKSTFGNDFFSNTAPMNVLVDGILVGQCADALDPCNSGPTSTPMFHTFTKSDFAALADGLAVLQVDQIALRTARLGASSLIIETAAADLAATPEPASLTLMAVGLTGAVSAAWRRMRPRPDA
jgi:hypothetical protein